MLRSGVIHVQSAEQRTTGEVETMLLKVQRKLQPSLKRMSEETMRTDGELTAVLIVPP